VTAPSNLNDLAIFYQHRHRIQRGIEGIHSIAGRGIGFNVIFIKSAPGGKTRFCGKYPYGILISRQPDFDDSP
jgi:hypothetical protein